MNIQMINSSMSLCTVEDSFTKVVFFLKKRNNFKTFFQIEAIYTTKRGICPLPGYFLHD
jgi:hypothetical protein